MTRDPLEDQKPIGNTRGQEVRERPNIVDEKSPGPWREEQGPIGSQLERGPIKSGNFPHC